jgi:hypothetical protein
MKTLFAILVAMTAFCATVHAQWVKVPAANTPLGADGKPNLTTPAPRLPDGKPDLSGIWEPISPKYLRDLAADLKPGEVPYQPWAKALVDSRADGSHAREESDANCLPQGIPKIAAAPAPWKIIQSTGSIVILHEAFNLWRQVFLDGRQFAEDLNPSWLGYSIGKWEGDTLVVDSKGFNGKTWLDQAGKPTTEALHVTERYRRKNFGTMEIQVTIDDPKAYTKPWTVTEEVRVVLNTDLLEFICNENNRDLVHLPGSALQ